jgi:pyruvate dehydrogenase E2 component (dihydrolipoamide acetyltransferase)
MDIVMPKMGESINEGTIIKWNKKQGDPVKRDEIIFEISTDKVDTEIPSPVDGILSEIKVNEGETVEVGTVVAIITESGPVSQSAKTSSGSNQPKPSSVNNQTQSDSVNNQPQSASIKSQPQSAPVINQKQLETENNQSKPASDKRQSRSESVNNQLQSASGKTESQPDIHDSTSSALGQSSNPAPTESYGIINIEMPKMGESVMEGTVIKWNKRVGDKVKKDEPLFEISTDKVDTEIPSPSDGTLIEIMVGEQETVEVGTIVARISSINKPSSTNDNSVQSTSATETKEETGFLSPLVLNIAKNENISFEEMKNIKGTGLQDRITKKDLLFYIDSKKNKVPVIDKAASSTQQIKEMNKTQPPVSKIASSPQSPLTRSGTSTQPPLPSDDVEIIPMDNIRQRIMQHMVISRDTSVHVTALIEVDMIKIYNFIQTRKSEFLEKEGVKLTYMPFIADAVIKALKEFPLVNSTIDGTTIYKKKNINLGIAVAMEPNGLIVPNIKKAGEKNLIGLAKAISELASNARNKKITPDDISHGTFTITNYGVFGTIFGTPIINQPEVAILGVGAVLKKPVVVEIEGTDSIAIRPIMALTLAHDHRLIDGMLGGKFLKFVKDVLESFNPASL